MFWYTSTAGGAGHARFGRRHGVRLHEEGLFFWPGPYLDDVARRLRKKIALPRQQFQIQPLLVMAASSDRKGHEGLEPTLSRCAWR